jgi:hypothetical protein
MYNVFDTLNRMHRQADHRYRLADARERGYVPPGYDPGGWKMINTIDCPYCNSKTGSFCVTKNYDQLPPSRSHRARWDEYWTSLDK